MSSKVDDISRQMGCWVTVARSACLAPKCACSQWLTSPVLTSVRIASVTRLSA